MVSKRVVDSSEVIDDLLLDIQGILAGASREKLLELSSYLKIENDKIGRKSRLSKVSLLLAEVEMIIDMEKSNSDGISWLTSFKQTLNGPTGNKEKETGMLIVLMDQYWILVERKVQNRKQDMYLVSKLNGKKE